MIKQIIQKVLFSVVVELRGSVPSKREGGVCVCVHVCVHTCLCECILCLWNNTTGHQIIFTCSDQNLWGRTIWKICLNSKLKPSVTATLVSCIPPWYRSLHCLINLEPTLCSRSCDTVPFSWVSSSSVELTRTSA